MSVVDCRPRRFRPAALHTGSCPPTAQTKTTAFRRGCRKQPADAAAGHSRRPRAAYDRQDSGDQRTLPAGSWRRGQEPEFSRLANSNDAVYAIALTLLVLQVGINPIKKTSNVEEMAKAIGAQGSNLFAFALAFVLIARYWMAHHAFFAMLLAWNRQIMSITLI